MKNNTMILIEREPVLNRGFSCKNKVDIAFAVAYIIISISIIFLLCFLLSELKSVNNSLTQIKGNQNSIILLLSKEYPVIDPTVKERKLKEEKTKYLEEQIFKGIKTNKTNKKKS